MSLNEEAVELGFEYAHKGCPCVGSPSVYHKIHDGKMYVLTIYDRRTEPVWKLTCSQLVVERGRQNELTSKIKAIWDL